MILRKKTKSTPEFLFVLGAGPKTATSTMTGILNCSPDIFVVFEIFKDGKLSQWSRRYICGKLCGESPDQLSIKRLSGGGHITKSLIEFYSTFDNNYRYIGNKDPDNIKDFKTLDEKFAENYSKGKVIFMVRDIRTWLAHRSISVLYDIQSNIISAATKYIYCLIKARNMKNFLIVKMEDLFEKENVVFSNIGRFLNTDTNCMKNWYNKIGNYSDADKNLIDWWTCHQSSRVKPTRQDTSVVLANNKMWDCILPIFDKYYNNCGGQDIAKDIDTLRSASKKFKATRFYMCYDTITQANIVNSIQKK